MRRELCILHVGMHKTGTTSIQSFLTKRLADPGFHYAALRLPNHSSELFCLFNGHPEQYHAHRVVRRRREDVYRLNRQARRALIDSFESQGRDTVEVISGEDILNLPRASLRNLRGFLQDYFARIQVVCYLRPPVSHAQSAFQEHVKHGCGSFDPTFLNPRYERVVNVIDTFGASNMLLRPFVRESLHQGDVVLDFCQALGINPPRKALGRRNTAISREATSLLYAFQKFTGGIQQGKQVFQRRHRLISALAAIGDSRLTFSSRILDPILRDNHNALKRLQALMGETLPLEQPDDQAGINSEQDLLCFSPSTLEQLSRLIGCDLDDAGRSLDPQQVSEMVGLLNAQVNPEPVAQTATNETAQPRRR